MLTLPVVVGRGDAGAVGSSSDDGAARSQWSCSSGLMSWCDKAGGNSE